MISRSKVDSNLIQFGAAQGWAGDLAEEALVQAFAGTDPTSLHFAKPDDAAQRRFWRVYYRAHRTSAQPRLNFVTPGGEAAILTNILPQDQMSWLAEQRMGLGLINGAVPLKKVRPLKKYAEFLEAKRQEQVKAHGSIVYIAGLGVRPAAQGQGLGGRLLRRVLEYADQNGMQSYLEASTPRSRQLYLRHGFVDVGRWDEAFPVFLMLRPPAASSGVPSNDAVASSAAPISAAAVVPQPAKAVHSSTPPAAADVETALHPD